MRLVHDMEMELRLLESFVVVAEELNVGRAAGPAASDPAVAEPADRVAGAGARGRAVRAGEEALRAHGGGGEFPGRHEGAAQTGRSGDSGRSAGASRRARDVAAAVRTVRDVRRAAAAARCVPGGPAGRSTRSGDDDHDPPDQGPAGRADRCRSVPAVDRDHGRPGDAGDLARSVGRGLVREASLGRASADPPGRPG